MKFLAIVLLGIGILSGVKEYTGNLKLQLSVLKEWKSIFEYWRDLIEQYSISVPELLEKSAEYPLFSDFTVINLIKDHDIQYIIDSVLSEQYIIADGEKNAISETLQKLGGSLIEAQIRDIGMGIAALDRLIISRENSVKERCTVIYKLAPLIGVAVAVILW